MKVSAILTQTPVSVPFNIILTFLGWQFLDKAIDDMSDDDARAKLKKLGFDVPDLSLIMPSRLVP